MPTASVLGLARLVKNCPKLSDIAISASLELSGGAFATPTTIEDFLASEFPSGSAVDVVDLSGLRLIDCFGMEHCRDIGLRDVARIFRKLWPNLGPEKLCIERENDVYHHWGCIWDLLEEMRSSRGEEVKRLRERNREIELLIYERDELAEECARLRCALEVRDSGVGK